MGYSVKLQGELRISPEPSLSDALVVNNARLLEDLSVEIPPEYNPDDYCDWKINSNGRLQWNGAEKSSSYQETLECLIKVFFAPKQYELTGIIQWQGDEVDDVGRIKVVKNSIEILDHPFYTTQAKTLSFIQLEKLILTSPNTNQLLIVSSEPRSNEDGFISFDVSNSEESWEVTFKMEEN